jgi:hypothetical protein
MAGVEIIVLILVIGLAVLFLKGFDSISGQGPKQVSDGIKQAKASEVQPLRIPCPLCAERILPQAKICPFCKSQLKD